MTPSREAFSHARKPPTTADMESSKNPRFRLSVSFVLVTSIGLLMAIMLGLVQWIYFEAIRKNTFELLKDKARGIVTGMENEIRHYLDPVSLMLEHLAHEMVSEEGLLVSDSRLRDLLAGGLLSQTSVGSINYFNENFRPFGLIPGPEGRPIQSPITNRPAWRNPDIQRLMQANKAIDGILWNQPEFNRRITFLVASHPVKVAEEYKGFLSAVVTVHRLSKIMVNLGERFNATPFILRGENQVLAHPLLISPHPSQSRENPLPTIDQLEDEVLQKIGNTTRVSNDFEVLQAEGIHIGEARVGNKEFIFLTKSITGYGENSLTIGAWVQSENLTTQISRLFKAIILGIVLLVVGIVLAMLLGRGIARPVQLSAHAATQLSRFDLDEVAPLPTSLYKELNDQANAFNSMLIGLRAFSQYVPKTLVERLIREEAALGSLSVERELTVMFTDIVGFTTLSESLSAADVATFLNQHFELLVKEIEAEGGTVDKFIGDAVMAFWGAPELISDAPIRACRAALEMRKVLDQYNLKAVKAGGTPVGIRIGIHTGPVVVGNIGSQGRFNYTIVGDTVNVTQRLESLARHHAQNSEAAIILISEETRMQLNDLFVIENLGPSQIKGRAKPLLVHRLL